LILFDEIEKAHPDIFNLLLQILEDGVLTDSEGRRVDFKNTVIIMTSNLGAQYTRSGGLGFAAVTADRDKNAEEQVMRALREAFTPEFLDRIDECIYFPPLTEESIKKICMRQLEEFSIRARESGVTLEYDESLPALICGDDTQGGARHLRRRIAKLCERPLSEMIVSGKLNKGDTAILSASGNNELASIEIIPAKSS
jgi:ATP-dependent Clp protease ATP-binding subunit ClpC